MSDRTLNMEIANLICRFGDQVLLDHIEDIVLPAFFDVNLVRRYEMTSHFLHQVSLVKLQENNNEVFVGLAGRFIKDTTLRREQIFEQGKGLVKDPGLMRSSPSAIFLLILNNHRLVYVRETRDAPTKESFKATLLAFLRKKHKDYIKKEYEKNKVERRKFPNLPKVTKRDLYEFLPNPTLDLIPLTSEDSIENFINKYNVLKTIEIFLSDRNDENDNDRFFEELQRRKDAIGSARSVVKHINNGGLNKEAAVKEVTEATLQGNQSVKLSGFDSEGDKLIGNNEHFQLRKPIDDLSDAPEKAAYDLYRSFIGLAEEGLIKLPPTSEKAMRIINSLIQRLSS